MAKARNRGRDRHRAETIWNRYAPDNALGGFRECDSPGVEHEYAALFNAQQAREREALRRHHEETNCEFLRAARELVPGYHHGDRDALGTLAREVQAANRMTDDAVVELVNSDAFHSAVQQVALSRFGPDPDEQDWPVLAALLELCATPDGPAQPAAEIARRIGSSADSVRNAARRRLVPMLVAQVRGRAGGLRLTRIGERKARAHADTYCNSRA